MPMILRYLKPLFLIFSFTLVFAYSGTSNAGSSYSVPTTGRNANPTVVQQGITGQVNGTTGQSAVSDIHAKFHYSQYASFITNIQKAGVTMATKFIPDAEGLAEILGGIAFTWLGLMIVLSQADVWHMGLRPVFMLAMTFGITMAMLENYAFFATSVVDGFIYAGGVLTSTNAADGFSVAGHMYANTMQVMYTMVMALKIHVNGSVFSEIEQIFTVIIRFGQTMLLLGPIMAIMLLVFFAFIVTFILFQIVIAVAIAVGPVFIPFLILPITKGLFEGWLKFLIMSGIYLMTAVVVASLVGTGMQQFANSMVLVTGSGTAYGQMVNFGIAEELVVFELVGLLAMLKVPEFAHAMAGSVNLSGMNVAGGAARGAVAVAKKAITAGVG
ncbi:conserved membrane protein of unknown function [Acidithiobacillus ferrivorans]|nr:type IV secretion system protein [Acidithiobacillus ferrivorans]SMH64779.1 conserved membrane protein of unknown function [Acidithiobacillus ferrivorans]